jgi:hypothetical protein
LFFDVVDDKLSIDFMAFIYQNPYREPYLAAQQELTQRRTELMAIQTRIQALETMIAALEPLATTEDLPPLADNLSELCCEVLMNSERPLTALEVRHRLGLMGIKIQGSNPMAILHTKLRRLVDRPGSEVGCRSDVGNNVYYWKGLRPLRGPGEDEEPHTGFVGESKSLPPQPPTYMTGFKKK